MSFWHAIQLLIIGAIAVSTINWAAGIVSWRLVGRKATILRFLEVFRANEFPPRFTSGGSLFYYLESIGSSCEYPEPLRRAAIDIERVLSFSEAHGEMMQWRMRSACEAAFEAYSPKAEAAQKGPRP